MYIIAHYLNIKPSWKDGVSTHFSDEKQQVSPPIPSDESNDLGSRLFDADGIDYTVFIDWSKLDIPALQAPILQPNDITLVNDTYLQDPITPEKIALFLKFPDDPDELEDLEVVYYGWNDREGGLTVDDLDADEPLITLKASAIHVEFR
jgi:hypothetical protein